MERIRSLFCCPDVETEVRWEFCYYLWKDHRDEVVMLAQYKEGEIGDSQISAARSNLFDRVIYRWSANGTFENSFMGLEPTHEKGDPVRGMTIDRYEGDKVAESWSHWDTLTFMRDVGAIPEGAAASA